MKPELKMLGAAAFAFTLAACFLGGESYQPVTAVPAAKAVVYVYRPYRVLSSFASPMITCGHESIEIDSGAYHAFIVDSGPIKCSVAASEVQFEARPGEQYYVKEDGSQLRLTRQLTGQAEIADTAKQVAADSEGRPR